MHLGAWRRAHVLDDEPVWAVEGWRCRRGRPLRADGGRRGGAGLSLDGIEVTKVAVTEPARVTREETSQSPPPLQRAPPSQPQTLYGLDIPISHLRVVLGRIAGCVAIAAGSQYIEWRLTTLSGAGVPAVVFWIAEAANLVALALTVALIWTVRRRPPATPIDCSLDVFVTVCGEPPAMVEQTLRAVLAITHRHDTYVLNDGRMAGKPSWSEIEDVCRRLGVTCFTRTTGPVGKAGNLNHALARTRGEMILTIDADHVAVPDIAEQLLGYFVDPQLAFVTTPQRFHASDDGALNNHELFFYRVIQPAKDAADSAFSCGNAIVYRRAALDTIDGFSEWNTVEDVHTSYELHALGWSSAYHNRPVTTGDAPRTLSELTRQRLRWASDSSRLLFWDNPLTKRGLSWRQRLHYLHTTGFYAIAATQVVFVISPPLYLLAGVSVMNVASVEELLSRSIPYYVAIALFFVAYCGPRESLQIVRQQLSLSPVYLLAVARALLHRPVPSSVTEKTSPPLLSWALLPVALMLALSLAALVSATLAPSSGTAIAGVWAAWFAFALGGPLAAVSRSHHTRAALRNALGTVVVALLAVLVLAQVRDLARPTRMALLPPVGGVYLGVFNPDVLQGPARLEAWSRRHGARARIVNSYQQWFSNETRFRADRARMIADQGGVLMITWEPWAKPAHSMHAKHQSQARLRHIAEGRYDHLVKRWAHDIAAYGRPLLIRFMHEMNGSWYPWAYGNNGNTARDVVEAWRHVHDIFTRAGATNVGWVWTINSFAGLPPSGRDVDRFYPGDAYVDWVSTTGFGWGRGHPRRSVGRVFEATLHVLERLGKPVMISEAGAAGSRNDAAAWVHEALYDLPRRRPSVRAVVWFDARYDTDHDFRLRGPGGAAFDVAVSASPSLRSKLRVTPAEP